eukprot:scaffold9559_cov101-Isochrysis_galbana.AAC.10
MGAGSCAAIGSFVPCGHSAGDRGLSDGAAALLAHGASLGIRCVVRDCRGGGSAGEEPTPVTFAKDRQVGPPSVAPAEPSPPWTRPSSRLVSTPPPPGRSRSSAAGSGAAGRSLTQVPSPRATIRPDASPSKSMVREKASTAREQEGSWGAAGTLSAKKRLGRRHGANGDRLGRRRGYRQGGPAQPTCHPPRPATAAHARCPPARAPGRGTHLGAHLPAQLASELVQ